MRASLALGRLSATAAATVAVLVLFALSPPSALACPEEAGNQECTETVPPDATCPPAGSADRYFANFILRDDVTNVQEKPLTFSGAQCPGGVTQLASEPDVKPNANGEVTNPDGKTTKVPPGHHVYRVNWRLNGSGTGGEPAPTATTGVTYTDPSGGGGTGTGTEPCTPVKLDVQKDVSPNIVFEYFKGSQRYLEDRYRAVPQVRDATMARGGWVGYIVYVTNVGDCEATDVVVSDPLPAGFSYDHTTVWEVFNGLVFPLPTQPSVSHARQTVKAYLGSIPKGGRRVVEIVGHGDSPGDQVNAASITASGLAVLATNPVRLKVEDGPKLGIFIVNEKGASGFGTSQAKKVRAAASSDPLARVEVAVQALDGKPCRWLDARGRIKRVSGNTRTGCFRPFWLRAKGTTHWSYRFKKRLPRGHYQLFIRPVTRKGVTQSIFRRSLHDLVPFTVR